MRGPKPTPTKLQLLAGNPRKRTLDGTNPEPPKLDADIPAELADDISRDEWKRTIQPAIKIGMITAADRVVAIAHCVIWSLWQRQVTAAKTNPLKLRDCHKTLTQLLKIDSELGLTPGARTRVRISAPSKSAEDSELDRILNIS